MWFSFTSFTIRRKTPKSGLHCLHAWLSSDSVVLWSKDSSAPAFVFTPCLFFRLVFIICDFQKGDVAPQRCAELLLVDIFHHSNFFYQLLCPISKTAQDYWIIYFHHAESTIFHWFVVRLLQNSTKIIGFGRKKSIRVILTMLLDEKESVMVDRRIWCCQWFLRREERGAYLTIVKESAIEVPLVLLGIWECHMQSSLSWQKNCRPSYYHSPSYIHQARNMYEKVYWPRRKVGPYIMVSCNRETFQSLSFQFRIWTMTISQIIIKVCVAIYHVFRNEYRKNTAKNGTKFVSHFTQGRIFPIT